MSAEACIIWDVSPVIFSLGPIKFRWYGLLFALVYILGYKLVEWQFKRGGMKADDTMRIVVYIFIGMLLGAFFGHRIFYDWDNFISNPLASLDITGGIRGLSSHGASAGIIIAVFLFHRKTKINFIELMDRITFGGTLATIFVRLGNLFNSEIVGRETDVAWAFCFPRYDHSRMIPRHPSQLYEALMGALLLLILFVADRLAGREKRPLGLMIGLFLTLYFSFRFFVEFFKEYQTLDPDATVTMGQILSIPFVLCGIGVIIWSLKTKKTAHQPAPVKPKAKPKKK